MKSTILFLGSLVLKASSSMKSTVLLPFLGSFLLKASSAGANAVLEPVLERARVSCNAVYNTPCARTNSKWLSSQVAAVTTQEFVDLITQGHYNIDTGFYGVLPLCHFKSNKEVRRSWCQSEPG